MPIALMVDGPSLGGFVCPATITSTQLWKMGQVRPGDCVRFRRLSIEEVGGGGGRVGGRGRHGAGGGGGGQGGARQAWGVHGARPTPAAKATAPSMLPA